MTTPSTSVAPRALWAVLAAAALVFAPGLGGPFVLDDHVNLAPVWQWLQGQQDFLTTAFGNHSGPGGRPLAYLTLMANAALGADATIGFKLVNVLLHVANTFLVFVLARRACALVVDDDRGTRLALIAAAVWALHPAQVSTVLYVVQRMTLLGATAQIAAALIYLEARTQDDPGRRRALMFLALPAVVAAGALAKESALIAPLLCAALEVTVLARRARPREVRAFFALFLLLPALAVLAWLALDRAPLTDGYAGREFTLAQRVFTEPLIVLEYAARWAWPAQLSLYRDGHAVVSGVASALPGWLACLGLAALAVALRRRAPLVALGIGWFLLGHLLEAGPFPLELYFEHRNYLPGFGLALLVAVALDRLAGTRAPWLAAPLVAVLALLAVQRSHDWSDTGRFLAAEAPPGQETSRRRQVDLAIHAVQSNDAAARVAALDVLANGDAGDRAAAAAWTAVFACDLEHRVGDAQTRALTAHPPAVLTHNHVSWLALLATRALQSRCDGLTRASVLEALRAWKSPAAKPAGRQAVERIDQMQRQLESAP